MAATSNYNLAKPTKAQNANIDTINANMDIIDTQLKNLSDNKAPLSHVGVGATAHPAVTTTVNGFMSATDKSKLDGIAVGAQVNVPTDITQGTRTATTVSIASSTGTGANLSAASTSLAGVMSATDKAKLDGIASGAQVNTVTSVASKTGAVTLVKGDVGLGSVENYGIATQTESELGVSDIKYMTPLKSKHAINKSMSNLYATISMGGLV